MGLCELEAFSFHSLKDPKLFHDSSRWQAFAGKEKAYDDIVSEF
jgi:hypothetical protein